MKKVILFLININALEQYTKRSVELRQLSAKVASKFVVFY